MTGQQSPPVRPPRISAWLLELGLPPGEHGQIIRGDLQEEFASRAASGSLRAARAWYRRQALSVTARYLVNPQKASIMDTLRQDVGYAVRTLAKSRGFTAAVLATLTIGIGAATAIFSFLNAVVIRPLPLPDADRLMFLTEYQSDGRGGPSRVISASWPSFADWRDRLTSFDGLAASRSAAFSIVDPEHPDRVIGRQATWNFLRVVGVPPAMGRDFSQDDDRPGAAGVVIIRHEFWQRAYGGAPDIVGQTIRLNGTAKTIVGVLPEGFGFARSADVWETVGQYLVEGNGLLDRGNHTGLNGIGRLKPGVSEQTARTELRTVAASLSKEYPNTNSGITADLEPLATRVVGDTKAVLWSLFAAVGCLLLIACVNVANLLVARGASRQQELALRSALGCGRFRLIRQLLVESLVLSLAGAALGLAAGWGLLTALLALAPTDTPRLAEVGLDASAVLFALGAALISGLLFGLLPALSSSGVHGSQLLVRSLRAGTSSATSRVRRVLIAVEVALALVLLTGAGLTLRTMHALSSLNPGFDPTGVLTARITVGGQGWDAERVRAFSRDLLAELRRLPGVTHAALALSLPVEGSQWGSVFIVGDKPVPPRAELPSAAFAPVSDEYFQALKVRLVAGRFFTPQDTDTSPRVAVVNETAAARLWPGENPIGKRVKQGWPEWTTPWHEVVGVAADLKLNGIDQNTPMQIYLPFPQSLSPAPAVIVRSASDPSALTQPLRDAVHRLVPSMPVYAVQTLTALMDGAVARQRASMTIFSIFALIAVILASIGLYGVIAQSVNQRTHEVGVRLALGATRGEVLRLFLRQGLVTIGAGLVAGAGSAALLSRFIEDLLFGVTPNDLTTLWTVTGMLFVVAVAVCYWSARRSTKIEAAVALRE
ncbi:MAG TPA: ADOP family duplicated permease [Vicinamibacterales bacterium]|nr:ADOP family duplicated permease [Vicinamibacterales bacterium]